MNIINDMEQAVITSRESQDQDSVQTALRDKLSTIYLGDVIDIWQDQRRICVGSHAEFAKHLLAIHKEYCVDYCHAESLEKVAHLPLCTNNQCTHLANDCQLFHDGSITEDPDCEDTKSNHDTMQEDITEQTIDATQEEDEVERVDVKSYACTDCGEKFSKMKTLESHMNTHEVQNTDVSSGCLEKLSPSRQTIAPAGEKAFVCVICDLTFKKVSKFQGHMKLHTGGKPHVCSYCGKGFNQMGHLKLHIRIHTGEKPHVCSECGKGFSQSGSLKGHMNTHNKVASHACPDCGNEFYDLSGLKRHMRTHTGEKPHLCPHCGMTFSRLDQFKAHTIIHTGEAPHVCFDCGKGFSTTRYLKRHVLIHTGEKPHLCHECGRGFNQAGNLKTHMKTHKIESTYIHS